MEALPILKTGDEIGGFRILEKIYEGGMATIYRVSKTDIELPLIMKIPKLAFGSHPACYVGFEVEQMILATLSGPHVPKFIAKGDMDATPYIVMEYIEGPALHDYIGKSRLDIPGIVRLVSALAAAVHDLHRQNVVHLDIKPANVLYRPTGEAVLVDFGLARHAYLPDMVEEEFHMPVGTSAYISPEQVVGRRCDPRSDIFAIGVILYQLSTGRLPFGAPTTIRGFRKRLYRDPVPPRRIAPGLPEWLQEITLHCLEVRASERYATAAQVACDLSHPEHVPLTARGARLERAGYLTAFRRWLETLWFEPPPCPAPSAHLAVAPHILVALDTTHSDEALFQALRDAVHRMVAAEKRCRITCVTVLEPSILTEEESSRELARSLYTQRLVESRHWAQPLELSAEQMRFHVLEAGDPATALLEYARAYHVDQIVMGARGSTALRRILGSVSSKVAAEAPCSVTVVRAPRAQ
ncbi:MAG: bifunctional serine/threonine-protein kinase/universal stress protein [Gallionella sp.]|nr:bifunctional serine/threonine-protein kinase/universal stress protein [Gallionella sp.]